MGELCTDTTGNPDPDQRVIGNHAAIRARPDTTQFIVLAIYVAKSHPHPI